MQTRIHVWGGLGSQLYAFALLLSFKEKYPSRRFKMIFHTGGVTERLPEITKLIEGLCTWDLKADFFEQQKHITDFQINSKSSYVNRFRMTIKNYLVTLGFIQLCNEPNPILQRWTLSVRGHYRQLTISQGALKSILDSIDSKVQSIEEEESSFKLHYRLGDLIGLKETIPPKIIHNVVREVLELERSISTLEIYSDSPELAKKLLSHELSSLAVSFPDQGIWHVLASCIKSRYFIGTNSKISYWVSYLRLTLNPRAVIYLPLALESDFKNTLGDLTQYQNLHFYSTD